MGYEKTKAWRERMDPDELRAYRREEARKYREKYPEKVKENMNRWRSRNREKVREQDKQAHQRRRKADPEGNRQRQLKHKAKLEAERERVAGRPRPTVCELCDSDEFKVVFDHCHSYGHFRGWICDRCNRVLGSVKDSPDLLEKMANYLRDHELPDHLVSNPFLETT